MTVVSITWGERTSSWLRMFSTFSFMSWLPITMIAFRRLSAMMRAFPTRTVVGMISFCSPCKLRDSPEPPPERPPLLPPKPPRLPN